MILSKLLWTLLNCLLKQSNSENYLKPEITRYSATNYAMMARLQGHNIEILYGILDSKYYYTDIEGWGQALQWIYLTQEMPKYSVVDGKWNLDCEDMTIWLKAMLSLHFGLNAQGIIIGDMPQGRHGFNMLITQDEELIWEPNPGFNLDAPFDIGENGYKPLFWFG